MTSPALIPDAVVALLLAAADTDFVPAQLWTLDMALVVLDRELPDASPVARALDRMPQASLGAGPRFTGLRRSIHRLVESGALVPEGAGWDAGYTVDAGFLDRAHRMLGALPQQEQTALGRAAQAFNDAARMLSKKSEASLPSGSARI